MESSSDVLSRRERRDHQDPSSIDEGEGHSPGSLGNDVLIYKNCEVRGRLEDETWGD